MILSPGKATLASDQVHVWSARLDPAPHEVAELRSLLSADELARAERFAFPHLRRRFIVGRGLLRRWLSTHLDVAPGDVRFSYELRGKPVLDACHESALTFNVSHSVDLAVFALTTSHRVGVDVEALRSMPDALTLAERFFSLSERRALRDVPPTQLELAFLSCWTRKEAYVKAIGDGLTCDLESFDVSVTPGERTGLLSICGSSAAASRWTVESFEPALGFLGAVAVESRFRPVQVTMRGTL